VTLIDSNVPMYLVGSVHPHKTDAQRLLERLVAQRERLVTDAEVLQEILHRYSAINRREAIQPAFESLLSVVDEVFPVRLEEARRARDIVLGTPTLSARDAIHLSVMANHGVRRILSFDRGFDRVPGIVRLST
jgi:predicted nucleic acid-binding protein